MREAVRRLAAKFDAASGNFHPLICHMVDVAAVAEIVWQDCLADRAKSRIAESFQLDEQSTGRWVAFLAGSHDLGKATPVFQAKGSVDRRSTPPWLAQTELAFNRLVTTDPGHGVVTAAYLPAFLTATFDLPLVEATRLAVITGGHHGIFPSAQKRRDAGTRPMTLGEPRRGKPNHWNEARNELASALTQLLSVRGMPAPLSNSTSLFLAGFISVVDWIGSIDDESYFPYAPTGPDDLDAYLNERRSRAGHAITQLHWHAWSRPSLPTSFQALFPEIAEPRHLQVVAQQIATGNNSPGLAILEAPMGEGKTEAAFYLADHWNASGYRGSYIAMPTQATSNQLYGRYLTFLKGRFGAGDELNLQLLHGHAALNAEVRLLSSDPPVPPPQRIAQGDDAGATVGAGEWFTYRKRGLLAPYGVGTIDQALMSVLQVRHGFVRLFGLAGKAVIIDEVHAYDTYMTSLLERLLEWLAALGSPVILLSATLPAARRDALAAAYRHGLSQAKDASPVGRESYPRVIWADAERVFERHVEASATTTRLLGISWLDPENLATTLLKQINDGGCAAVICNTVGRAQEVYLALKDAFAGFAEGQRPKLALFHARFLFQDRQEREERCLRWFGKPDQSDGSTRARPLRAVLVATQVIEQSLDLDFDVMVSDLAPLDLLLQRSGRLHRHERTDWRGPDNAVLQILAPALTELLPAFERATTYVYDEHILLRTWLTLRDRAALSVPEDIEDLIEAVYSESEEGPSAMSEAVAQRWRSTLQVMNQKREREREEARLRRIPTPVGRVRLEDYTRDPREEDSPELHPAFQAITRLAQASVQVALLKSDSRLLPLTRVRPSLDGCRQILQQSVSITTPDVTRELLSMPVPPAWQESSLLRRVRVLSLDGTNACQVGRVTLQYDPELGLRFIRP